MTLDVMASSETILVVENKNVKLTCQRLNSKIIDFLDCIERFYKKQSYSQKSVSMANSLMEPLNVFKEKMVILNYIITF